MSLKARLAIRTVVTLPLLGAMMFAPAGSFRYWQGWVFLAIFASFSAVFSAYLYIYDRALLERRLKNKEPRREQRIFKRLWMPLWICALILPGFDYRYGWSEDLLGSSPPVWLMVFCWGIVIAGWVLVFYVMRFNSFASTVVEVAADHKVITNGPYGFVRHPMYTGFTLMVLATPVGLGSYVALVPAIFNIPLMILRLIDEERLLRKELPGYAEYCQQTRFRLIPSVY